MTTRWKVTAVHFSRLTVGDTDPLATGCVQLTPDDHLLFFRLCWREGRSIRADLLPGRAKLPNMTYRELTEIEQELKAAYRRILFCLLYGTMNPDHRRTLSVNAKVLRAGRGLSPAEAARCLDVRTETLLRCEQGIVDLGMDLQKYITPSDSLLFRMAKLYRLSDEGAWDIYSPHFFLHRYVRDFCYDLGANPIQKGVRPNLGRTTVEEGAHDKTPLS